MEQPGPNGEGLAFTIRNFNIQKWSARERLAAYLILRYRISDLAGGMMGEILEVNENIRELPEDLGGLIQQSLDKLEGLAVHTFLVSPLGNGQTGAQWLETIIRDPLFTSTKQAYMKNMNGNRRIFLEKARTILNATTPV